MLDKITYSDQVRIGRWLARIVSLAGNFSDQALVVDLRFGRCHLLGRGPRLLRPFERPALGLSTTARMSIFGSPSSGTAVSG